MVTGIRLHELQDFYQVDKERELLSRAVGKPRPDRGDPSPDWGGPPQVASTKAQ